MQGNGGLFDEQMMNEEEIEKTVEMLQHKDKKKEKKKMSKKYVFLVFYQDVGE